MGDYNYNCDERIFLKYLDEYKNKIFHELWKLRESKEKCIAFVRGAFLLCGK